MSHFTNQSAAADCHCYPTYAINFDVVLGQTNLHDTDAAVMTTMRTVDLIHFMLTTVVAAAVAG